MSPPCLMRTTHTAAATMTECHHIFIASPSEEQWITYIKNIPSVDNARLQNTGGEHSTNLVTEAEEQRNGGRISARNL